MGLILFPSGLTSRFQFTITDDYSSSTPPPKKNQNKKNQALPLGPLNLMFSPFPIFFPFPSISFKGTTFEGPKLVFGFDGCIRPSPKVKIAEQLFCLNAGVKERKEIHGNEMENSPFIPEKNRSNHLTNPNREVNRRECPYVTWKLLNGGRVTFQQFHYALRNVLQLPILKTYSDDAPGSQSLLFYTNKDKSCQETICD